MNILKSKIFNKWHLNQPVKNTQINSIIMRSNISKVIHQTYSKKELPPEINLNIQKIKALNPDWDYRFYDDSDIESYIQRYFPALLKPYLSINPKYGAARADLFRYLVLYREGGVYLDIKSSFTKPLDDVILTADQFLLSHWNSVKFGKDWGKHVEIDNLKGEFQQCFIIAAAGHPFLKIVIENVLRNLEIYNAYLHKKGSESILKVTGPIAYTLAILSVLDKYPYRLVQSDQDLGFVYNIYEKISSKNHLELFEIHYSKLKEPLVIR